MTRQRASPILAACLALAMPVAGTDEPPTPQARDAAHQGKVVRTDRHGDPLPEGAVVRLGTVRWRAGDAAFFLAFSPDGKALWSVGLQKVIRWDAATGELAGPPRRLPEPYPVGFALSADRKTLAVASRNRGTIILWDVNAEKEIRRWKGSARLFPPHLECLAFSPDGATLATRERGEAAATLWQVATGKEVRRLGEPAEAGEAGPAHQCGCQAAEPPVAEGAEEDLDPTGPFGCNLAYSPDGRLLALLSEEGELRVYDVGTGKETFRAAGESWGAWCVTFSPDGKRLAWVGGVDRIHVWDVGARKPRPPLVAAKTRFRCVAFAPDGRSVVSGDKGGRVRLWDVKSGKERWRTEPQAYMILSVACSGKVVAAGAGTAIHLLDAATGKDLFLGRGHSGPVDGLAFSPDGKRLATSAGWRQLAVAGQGMLRLWEVATGKELLPPLRTAFGFGWPFTFSPDGKVVGFAGADDRPAFWDTATGKRLSRYLPRESALGVAAFTVTAPCVPHAGRAVLTPAAFLGGWEAAQDGWGGAYRPAAFPVDLVGGEKVRVTLRGGIVLEHLPGGLRLRQAVGGKRLSTIVLPTSKVEAAAVSPDGRTLALSLRDTLSPAGPEVENCWLTFWEVATGRLRTPARKVEQPPESLRFSPNGRWLVASGYLDEADVSLWDVATGREVRRFPVWERPTESLAFSPDGRLLALGGRDGSVLLWDLAALARLGKGEAAAQGSARNP
jgi:WD40 repeat protein